MPTNAKFGFKVIGAWVNRTQNEFSLVLTFENEDTLKTQENSPERAGYTGSSRPHIAKIEMRNVEDGLLV